MAYEEGLAARVRALLASRADVSERKMFGGLTFMVGGTMCCSVNGDELIVRLDPGREDDVLARPPDGPHRLQDARLHHHAPDGLPGSHLDQWVHEAAARAGSLPPK
jgi:hypothetical protein